MEDHERIEMRAEMSAWDEAKARHPRNATKRMALYAELRAEGLRAGMLAAERAEAEAIEGARRAALANESTPTPR